MKHPLESKVYLYGSSGKEDSLTVERTISALNKLSPNVNLRLAAPPSDEPDHGIVLYIHESAAQKEAVKSSSESIAGTSCMFKKLVKNRVVLSVHPSERGKQMRQRSIIDAIYFSLVHIPREPSLTNELYELHGSKIEFKPRYAELLKLVYSNEFLDGLPRSEFDKITLRLN